MAALEHRQQLGERYLSMGLNAAAEAVFLRLTAFAHTQAHAHRRLAELAQHSGRYEMARQHVGLALNSANSAPQRYAMAVVLVGIGDNDSARVLLEETVQDAYATLTDRVTARLALAGVAVKEGKLSVAAQSLHDAFEQLADSAMSAAQARQAAEIALQAHCIAMVESAVEDSSDPGRNLLRALVYDAAGQPDPRVDDLLRRAAPLPFARLALALRLARRRGRDVSARREAIDVLENLLTATAATFDPGEGTEEVQPGRIHLLLASLYDDNSDDLSLAERHYKRALLLLPHDALACNNLGAIALRTGREAEARSWFIRALCSDPAHEMTHLNLARLIYAASSSAEVGKILSELQQDGPPDLLTGDTLAHLLLAVVDVAREDTLESLADRGHQLKNLLGVVGARLRSLVRSQTGVAHDQLRKECDRVTDAYGQWAVFLRTMREEPAGIDAVSVNDLIKVAAQQAGGSITLDLAPKLPEVRGVRRQLTEALVNLMRNGLDAQDGALSLAVRTSLVADGNGIQVDVSDQGEGIAKEDLRRIFTPGYTTKADGGGVGLSISERVVHSHGGRLEIQSRPGEGTVVRIVLPVHLESRLRYRLLGPRALSSVVTGEYVVED